MESKACSKCHTVYQLKDYFWDRSRLAKDGFSSWCKPCRKIVAANQHQQAILAPKTIVESKQCITCKTHYNDPYVSFGKHNRAPDGLRNQCRACRYLDGRKYRVENVVKNKHNPRCAIFAKCWSCGITAINKDIRALFGFRTTTSNGVANQCLACNSAAKGARKENRPVYANELKISGIIKKRMELTASTGIQHHVDHIIPLKGELVCGLDIETNMGIITATENTRKNNKYDPCGYRGLYEDAYELPKVKYALVEDEEIYGVFL